MLTLVYAELSTDPGVRADLDALLDQVRPLVKDSPFVSASPPPLVFDGIATFVAKWHLPSDFGRHDVWTSVREAGRGRLPGEKKPDGVRLLPIRRGMGFENERRASRPRNLIHAGSSEKTISPPVVTPFFFDPTTQSRRYVERLAEKAAADLRREILRQADDTIRAWHTAFPEWGRMAPRFLKPGEMRRIARRIAHAMLDWSSAEIAKDEAGPRAEPAEYRKALYAVRKTLQEWPRDLKIQLPRRVGKRVLTTGR